MRVRSIQWKPGDGATRFFQKIDARMDLISAGANVNKCRPWFDWWEVEWPN